MNEEVKEEILALSKEFAGIYDDSQDNKLRLTVTRVLRRVLNYCNLTELPLELYEIVAEMVVDMSGINGSSANSGVVKSIKRGDYSVTYADSGTGLSLDNVLSSYKPQLVQFKRIRTIKQNEGAAYE